ncbi:DUF881 domain-containing protein [Pseudofrankia sp. DC12]|uniref:DUF881 domain-containing protein n=1 Tax=Pseudofrankia sp. DC12 TaxID=683315 RepID=UPI0005F86EDD|nr:DUF881 domain-containing protein [Pseudofrankia sp. DC12]
MHSGGKRRAGQARRLAVALVAALAGLLLVLARGPAGGAQPPSGSALAGERHALADVVAADQAEVDRSRDRLVQARADLAAPAPLAAPEPALSSQGPPAGCAGVGADAAAVPPGCAGETALLAQAGLTPVHGTAIIVSLDDTPRDRRAGPWPSGVRAPVADDLVVHQQDVQAVVNALWAGGARAMTLMGRRVTALTAVRCVGNTLLLEGNVYSPPFVVAALGDPARLTAALDADPGVVLYREYVDAYDLGYHVETNANVTFPAATEPPTAVYATPLTG